MYDVIVAGGGAAGFFAALRAASSGARVTIIEKSAKLLAKVRVSGGGRCNVTHNCFEPRLLAGYYPRGSKELLGPLTRFGPVETINWFKQRNVHLKTEADGRMFPVTDSSQTIIDCFLNDAQTNNVDIRTGTTISAFKKINGIWNIETTVGACLTAKSFIIATGGSPVLSGYNWLQSTGHTIVPPVPSLFTFNIPDNPFEGLQGLSVPNASVLIEGTAYKFEGPLLFTHWGLSGPAVLKTSAWAARRLAGEHYRFAVLVSYFPHFKDEELRELLNEKSNKNPAKTIHKSPLEPIASRLWERLCLLSDISPAMRWSDAGKKRISNLINMLLRCRFNVSGKTTFKEEFVTCGGVSLKEINMKRMESKLHEGLYFAGEVLDIDGVTGGFNFQAAWTTGWIAGSAAAGI
ncbi:MAG TPA: NAD(P)/FAD-dependent oxidoreductase [Bacteroidia bacterium]|nr:NAD(P)/FAD-dependent oxidoreductase [Bacteroidia bacterium]